MSEKIIYKINKGWAKFKNSPAYIFIFIMIFIQILANYADSETKGIILFTTIVITLIPLIAYDIYIKKQIVGEINISSNSVQVLLNDKEYIIDNSNIDKISYYDLWSKGKIKYQNGEEDFEIKADQANIRKIKNTIEEKMQIKIKNL